MDLGEATAPVAAVVGVVGTPLSALPTQRAADRGRWREPDRVEQVQERRPHARELRACSVALDASARQYLAALTDQVHALGRDEEPRLARQRLTRARDQYRDVYAEARMRLPERVLDLVAGLGHDLGPVYGMVRRLDDGVPRAGDSPEAVRESIDELWGRLRRARRGIRTEPGVHGADPGR